MRSADGVAPEVAGSAWVTFLDACNGFNQVRNTESARRMLAIFARSGQFLPRCLTFGLLNGPDDSAYATECTLLDEAEECVSAKNGRYMQMIARSGQDASAMASSTLM